MGLRTPRPDEGMTPAQYYALADKLGRPPTWAPDHTRAGRRSGASPESAVSDESAHGYPAEDGWQWDTDESEAA